MNLQQFGEIWFDAARTKTLQPEALGDSMYLFYQNRFKVWIDHVEDHIYVRART